MAKTLWILAGLLLLGGLVFLACRMGTATREAADDTTRAAEQAIDQAEQLRLATQEKQRELQKQMDQAEGRKRSPAE